MSENFLRRRDLDGGLAVLDPEPGLGDAPDVLGDGDALDVALVVDDLLDLVGHDHRRALVVGRQALGLALALHCAAKASFCVDGARGPVGRRTRLAAGDVEVADVVRLVRVPQLAVVRRLLPLLVVDEVAGLHVDDPGRLAARAVALPSFWWTVWTSVVLNDPSSIDWGIAPTGKPTIGCTVRV